MIRILCADMASADWNIYDRLYAAASRERKERADRCLRLEDKLHCVTADALLKKVLGTADCRVGKSPFGKPCVQGREGFHFNISHSGRYVVIAWGDSEIGVDVQQEKDKPGMEAIAGRWFTSDEQAYMQNDRRRFYEIWSAKESYIKYTGKGLHMDLRSFSVLAPEPGIRYHHLELEGGYSLCLCTTEDTYTVEILDVGQLLER